MFAVQLISSIAYICHRIVAICKMIDIRWINRRGERQGVSELKKWFCSKKQRKSVVKTPLNQFYANSEITVKLKKLNRKKKKRK